MFVYTSDFRKGWIEGHSRRNILRVRSRPGCFIRYNLGFSRVSNNFGLRRVSEIFWFSRKSDDFGFSRESYNFGFSCVSEEFGFRLEDFLLSVGSSEAVRDGPGGFCPVCELGTLAELAEAELA